MTDKDNPIEPIVANDEDGIARVLSVEPARVTDGDIDWMIAHMRKERALFIAEEAGGSDAKEKPEPPATD